MKFIADPRYQLVMKYLTGLMSLAYMALGGAILLSVGDLAYIPAVHQLPLGLMLMGYGLFRAYRFAIKHLSRKGGNEIDEQ